VPCRDGKMVGLDELAMNTMDKWEIYGKLMGTWFIKPMNTIVIFVISTINHS
jgi:hypothetical protein